MKTLTLFGLCTFTFIVLLLTVNSAFAIKEDVTLNFKPTMQEIKCNKGWELAYELPQESNAMYYCAQNKKYQLCTEIKNDKCIAVKEETKYYDGMGKEYGVIDWSLIELGLKQPVYSQEFKNKLKKEIMLPKHKVKDTEPQFDIVSLNAKLLLDGQVSITYSYSVNEEGFDFGKVPISVVDMFGTQHLTNDGSSVLLRASFPLELHFGATSEVYNISPLLPVGFNVTNGSSIVILNNVYDHPIKPNVFIEGWSNTTNETTTDDIVLSLTETSRVLNLTGLSLLNQQVLRIFYNGSGDVSYNNLNSFYTWELTTYTDEVPTYKIENYYPILDYDCSWLYNCTNISNNNITATINKTNLILWFAGKVINTT